MKLISVFILCGSLAFSVSLQAGIGRDLIKLVEDIVELVKTSTAAKVTLGAAAAVFALYQLAEKKTRDDKAFREQIEESERIDRECRAHYFPKK